VRHLGGVGWGGGVGWLGGLVTIKIRSEGHDDGEESSRSTIIRTAGNKTSGTPNRTWGHPIERPQTIPVFGTTFFYFHEKKSKTEVERAEGRSERNGIFVFFS